MNYEQVASISQVLALLFFIGLFVAVLVYAFWPGNKKKFDDAAKLPLEDDDEENNKPNGDRS